MRRNLNSKKLIFLVLLIAFFTIVSYFFDQMVIRKEDDLRNFKIKLENITVKIGNINDVNKEIITLQTLVVTSAVRFQKLRNYWFKNLLILSHPRVMSDTKKQEIKSSFESKVDAGWYIKTRFLEHFKNSIWTHNSIRRKMKNIYDWQYDLFPKYFETIDGIIYSDFPEVEFSEVFNEIKHLLTNKNFSSYADITYDRDKFDDAHANFNIQDWTDLHKYTFNLINKFDFYYNLIKDDSEYLDKLGEKEAEVRNSLVEKITITNSRKNYFILSSIISQIFSLLFLLLLFRLLLLGKKKTK